MTLYRRAKQGLARYEERFPETFRHRDRFTVNQKMFLTAFPVDVLDAVPPACTGDVLTMRSV